MENKVQHADTVVRAARIRTEDPARPWAEAMAVTGGVITFVGSAADVAAYIGPDTRVVDAQEHTVMPGLSEGHVHLSLGGEQTEFELPIEATDDLPTILTKVKAWADRLGPDDWVVGGVVGATVIATLESTECLRKLDEASGGRPVLLRDDSLHNRWVNQRTLDLLGIDAQTPDPPQGRYVRDDAGNLTGILQESTTRGPETAYLDSISDPMGRTRTGIRSAQRTLSSFGFTSAQDAGTMGSSFEALRELEDSGELNLRVVASMPVRQFIQGGTFGPELIDFVRDRGSDLVRPDFVKVFIDGVPMTRTSAMLEPYRCVHGQTDTSGEPYWTLDDLVAQINTCYDQGMGAKFHAGGNAAVRLVLDAVQKVREERGPGPQFQLAHTEFVHADDIARLGEMNVVADASPFVWYPSTIHDSISDQVPGHLIDESWPFRQLLDSGAIVSAGSDWPCASNTPDPWTGLQTMVTRRNPDPRIPGQVNPSGALTLEEAVTAFTSAPAEAMGLGEVTGRLKPGFSADFIVLDRDLFASSVDDIHTTQVQATYFRGELVYFPNSGATPDGDA